ncbi:MAG: hypothetical protein CO129_12385 [Ignavibacteriales bacterium CG_4_9_14_3_um_filter_34_10]|nr:MAG: hypothetical protein CO129_12385 [Ignavibacteriales bacterium CG_4_9_14_3_um_filter_34_10]
MKRLIIICILLTVELFAQTTNLNLDQYKSYLQSHQNLIYENLVSEFPTGQFLSNITSNSLDADYLDSIELKIGLTEYEKELLSKHGFVVTERLKDFSFGQQFEKIYNNDLPVFISTDAILHAFHSSYDKILKRIEVDLIIPKLKDLLTSLHSSLPAFSGRYSAMPEMEKYLKDLDFYLTVPLKLFNVSSPPNYVTNTDRVNKFYKYVMDEQFIEDNFLSSLPRKMDFSQFKPRGHYTDKFDIELKDYFRVMMWFGRMELYLIAPVEFGKLPKADEQRQAIVSYLIQGLIDYSGNRNKVNEIEKIIAMFVGEQDNVTLQNLDHLKSEIGFNSASYLLDTNNFNLFQNKLKEQPYADQKILSQVLLKDVNQTEDLKPASAFMLFGQRFVIDSYVTGNVVFDKIKFEGHDVFRALPSLLDVLFSLGNNATLQLLQSELEQYKYSSNLSALRFLIDNYTDEFWNSTIYSGWLKGIRSLNPPADRLKLPEFMQTAAWWQEKINTQLASWTELRHDNLLYAKQSYTGGTTCSYPSGYVEPFPQFYLSMKELVNSCYQKISAISFENENEKNVYMNYFENFYSVCDTLGEISQKELAGIPLTKEEVKFIQSVLSKEIICGITYNGWYKKLFFESWDEEEGLLKKDYLVADYHTAPTDESGAMVGWVKHAGTGPIDVAIVITNLPNGNKTAFVGPVMSYFEYTTEGFLRLTDEEWKASYLESAARPSFVNLYLADGNGKSRGSGNNLLMSVQPNPVRPDNYEIKAVNYPNPFNPSTLISFNVPNGLAHQQTEISIVNIQGEIIDIILKDNLPEGNYLIKWNGSNKNGNNVSSGIYFYRIKIGDKQFVGKMNLIK